MKRGLHVVFVLTIGVAAMILGFATACALSIEIGLTPLVWWWDEAKSFPHELCRNKGPWAWEDEE